MGTGGAPGSGGLAGAGGSTGTGEYCTLVKDYQASSTSTPSQFGTTGPYCFRISGDLLGWGCANTMGRTIKVNGVELSCGAMPLPPKTADGWYYFDVSAGTADYAYIYWW